MNIKTKYCGKCDMEKPSGYFYANKRAADGLSTNCKRCMKEYNRAYKKQNKYHGVKTL